MNLPNKLTILRVIMIPFFVVFMLTNIAGGASKYIALVLFAAASFTDTLDGHIARKYNLVTNFGKFMDPLADKLLVGSAMICMVQTAQLPAWVVIVIIGREFIISGFRLVAADNGVVIAAGIWGKMKTVVQMIMILLLILNLPYTWYQVLCDAAIWLSVILTIVSLVDYIAHNKEVLKDSNH